MTTQTEEKAASVSAEKTRVRELMSKIAELGGKGMKEEDIEYIGMKLTLPERWRGNLGAAISYLQKKKAEDDEVSVFSRSFNYRPWDGAVNAILAMKEAFGMVSGKTTYSFFGPNPPRYIQVPISATETEEVPWGVFQIPLLENTQITFGTSRHADYGDIFQVTIEAPRKHRFIIEGLWILIDQKLKANSIYRGKAIDGQSTPQFLDLAGFDDGKIVYAEQVQADLDANLWDVLRHSDANRKLGLPLKRAVLCFGPYGTGKSLAGTKTAVEAVAAGWTFLMARPGRDNFAQVMQTARLYQPAVVFMEDVETVASAENQEQISQMLDLFDGIQAKNTDLMVVLTTNHPDELHKGMMRPGRLDAIIEIAALDDAGVEKLIRCVVGKLLADDVDFKPVCEAARGYLPAFLKEVADRAVRYSLSRQNGDTTKIVITTEDLVHAAQGLRPQFERMEGAKEFSTGDTLAESLGKIMNNASKRAVAELATNAKENEVFDQVWSPGALAEAQNGKH